MDIFSALDVRLDKKWNFEKFALNLFIEAQNILRQNNPSPPEYGLNRDASGMITQPRSLVTIAQGEGSVIPGIGIVIDF